MPEFTPTPERIAVMRTKYWANGGVQLTVGFMDNPEQALRDKILSHMNAWGQRCNVAFTETSDTAQVRISRGSGGYWSYIGTDILQIPSDQQTMNLEGFTLDTLDSEFYRVVRHETGHTIGCPHEHMRSELVALIDPDKAIAYFGETQGWSADEVRQQVLTPLEDSSLWGTPRPDQSSIMCYQIPGTITKSGQPILGGTDIDESDFAFMAQVYPQPASVTKQAPAGRPADAAAIAQLRSDNEILKKAIGVLAR
ncbi:MAG TPA: M12 family metallopeptidase [Roseiarcus sp.]|nr:M12 family metallopeptidase [Roseiarcus sp.]